MFEKIKKIMAWILVLSFFLSVFPNFPVFAESNKQDNSEFIMINTAEDLDNMRNNLSAKYKLNNDIDLSGYISKTNTAVGGWHPIGIALPYFKGEFDGNGHTISGQWSNSSGGAYYKGLFATLDAATIKNINIELADSGISGAHNIGGIAGYAKNATLIENCHVKGGSLSATAGGFAGGLVGYTASNDPIIIKDSSVSNTVVHASDSYSGGLIGMAAGKTNISNVKVIDTKVSGTSYVGGLVGSLAMSTVDMAEISATVEGKASYVGGLAGTANLGSHISKSISKSTVSASHYAGGLVGSLYEKSSIKESAAYGNVSTKYYIAGGIVGEAVASTIENCYARGDISGTTGVGGLVGYFSGSGKSYNKSVENSYSSGKINGSGTSEYGAFCGRSGVEFKGTNYYDKDKASVAAAYGTAGLPVGQMSSFPQAKSTDEMHKKSSYVNWDFENIWKIDEGKDYPVFKFEFTGEEPDPPVDPSEAKIEFKYDNIQHEEIKINEDTIATYYYIEDEIDGIYAEIKGSFTPVKVSYSIKHRNLVFAEADLSLSKNIEIKPATLFIGLNTIIIEAIDKNNNIIKAELNLENSSPKNQELIEVDADDSDGDNVENFIEEIHGTDVNKLDTDDDDLTDYEEIYLVLTNPTIYDSYEEGIADADADIVLDGLSNKVELEYKTEPLHKDTDRDGFTDYEEIYIYFTDPLNPDENNNNILDGEEITSEDNSYGQDEEVKLNVTIKGKSSKIKELNVEVDNNHFYLNENTSWLISKPYNLSHNGDFNFDELTLEFEFDANLLNDPNFEPTIAFLHPESNELIVLDDFIVDNNKIILNLKNNPNERSISALIGFILGAAAVPIVTLTFCIIDYYQVKKMMAKQVIPVPEEKSKGKDVIFLIDLGKNMSDTTYEERMRFNDVAKELLVNLSDDTRVAIYERYIQTLAFVPFVILGEGNKRKTLTTMFLNTYIQSEPSSYVGDSLVESINILIDYFDQYSESKDTKHIVYLSNDQDINMTTVKKTKERGIIISQVSLSFSSTSGEREALTGGEFFSLSTDLEQNKNKAKFLSDFINSSSNPLHTLDSDMDGLPDEIEEAINDGRLEEFSGRKLHNKLDPKKHDTDNDGLLDGDEIELIESDVPSHYAYYKMLTDPTKEDSDDDSINDGLEVKGIPTSIGIIKTNPQKKDTDGDGLIDGEEINISEKLSFQAEDLSTSYYYKANSNPVLVDSDMDSKNDKDDSKPLKYGPSQTTKENVNGLEGRGFSAVIYNKIVKQKEDYYMISDANVLDLATDFNGHKIDVLTNILNVQVFLLEYDDYDKPLRYWLEIARVGYDVRGGHGDRFYVLCNENPNDMDNPKKPISLMSVFGNPSGTTLLSTDKEVLFNKYPELSQPSNFIYYNYTTKTYSPMTDSYVHKHFNCDLRYELNDDYDKYLPANPQEAENQGFSKLFFGNKYHAPDYNHKYVHADGREGIYNKGTGKSMILFEDEYTKRFGPTFNYIVYRRKKSF